MADRTAVDFEIPPGACDCHTHVFGDGKDFPWWEKRVYTPPPASADELLQLQNDLRLSRVVIVHPSVYGADNSASLDGIRRLGARARGVAVIDPATTRGQLDEMAGGGIRGVRLNLETAGEFNPDSAKKQLDTTARQIDGLGWHVQFFTRPSVIAALQGHFRQAPFPIVIDHFGNYPARAGHEPAALRRAGRSRQIRHLLCEGFRRLSGVEQGPRLSGRGAARARADRGECRPHRLGHRLAASGPQQAGERDFAADPGR